MPSPLTWAVKRSYLKISPIHALCFVVSWMLDAGCWLHNFITFFSFWLSVALPSWKITNGWQILTTIQWFSMIWPPSNSKWFATLVPPVSPERLVKHWCLAAKSGIGRGSVGPQFEFGSVNQMIHSMIPKEVQSPRTTFQFEPDNTQVWN